MTAVKVEAPAVAASLRRMYGVARNLPDRLLHGRRHLAVRRQLAGLPRPRTILVVCYGNVCRSPYLEAVLQRALRDVRVTSAGFMRAGRRVPESLLSASAERGIDLSGFRSRPLEPKKVGDIDLVVAMDPFQAYHLMRYLRVPPERIIVAGDLDPVPGATRAIQDPFQQPVDVVLATLDRLDRCAATLIATVRLADPR